MLTKNFVSNVVRAQISKLDELTGEVYKIRDANLDEHKPMSDIMIGQYLYDIISELSHVLYNVDLYSFEHSEMTTSAMFEEIYKNYIEWCGHTISILNELNDQLPDLYLSREDAKKFDAKSELLYGFIELAWDTSLKSRSWMEWPDYIDKAIETLSESVLNFKQGTFLMKTE